MKNWSLYILLMIFALQTIVPHSLNAQTGERVFEFLNLPKSTYTDALGGVNVSSAKNDISLTFDNPALLNEFMHNNISANYMFYLADIGSGNIIYGRAINDLSNWAVGVNFMNYGKFNETTHENINLGTFSGKDIAINGFYSRRLSDRWSGGVGAKFIYSAFADYNSTALGVDIGLSYQNFENLFDFGVVVSNLGAQISTYAEQRVSMPWNVTMGFSKELAHAPLRFSVTATHLNRWKLYTLDPESNLIEENSSFFKTLIHHMILGVDIQPTDNFWLALGFNPKRASDMQLLQGGRLSGFTIGAGLNVRKFGFGVAVSKCHPSATTMNFNVTVMLGDDEY